MTTDLAPPAAAAVVADEHGPAVVFQGLIRLEWPAPRPREASGGRVEPLPACLIAVFDAASGKQIMTVSKVEIHAPASGLVTADLTMFADARGEPVYDLDRKALRDGREQREETFPFLVAEMRVRP